MKKQNVKLSEELVISCDFECFEQNQDKFIFRQLDIHDHWLTAEEAKTQTLSYPVLVDKGLDLQEYFAKESLILKFLQHLFRRNTILLCQGNAHFSIESEEEFTQICTKSLREEELMTLHLPELHLTVYGNFDLNLPFNFSAKDSLGVSIIEKELKQFAGLYFLKPR